MDDLFGFLFGAFIVVVIAYFILIAATTGLLNLYVLLDPVLAGLWFLPAPLSWGLSSAVFVGLLHFACAESAAFQRPRLTNGLVLVSVLWLCVPWLTGLAIGPAKPSIGSALAERPSPPVRWSNPVQTPPPQPPRRTPPQAPSTPYETAYVDTDQLNLRQGPSTQFNAGDRISRGGLVRIFARHRDSDGRIWARVRAGSSEGWVSERYLRRDAAAKPSDPPPSYQSGAVARVNTTRLNLRAGPGVGNDVVGKLDRGTAVQVFERRLVADGATWVRIRSGIKQGWVNARLLSFTR